MTLRFTVPDKLPGLNEYINACRTLRYDGARVKKDAQQLIACGLHKHRNVRFKRQVFVRFLWVEPNKKRDKDNVAFAKKFIFDALVKAKILTGDGWAHVKGFSDDFDVNKSRPRVEVEITEVGSEYASPEPGEKETKTRKKKS